MDTNRVIANRVIANNLSAYALSGSSLANGQLANGSLVFNTDNGDGIQTTEGGREIIDYMVRCALGPGMVLQVEHADVTHEYEGIVGLAPEWTERALGSEEKSRLSACLFAHVNHFGLSVLISLRFPGILGADATEAEQYQVREGGFYGEYFVESGPVKWYSCQGDSTGTALVNSNSRDKRVCTDADSGCAIESMGRCHDVCDTYTPGTGWSDCKGGNVTYHSVANVFLYSHDPDVQNETCGIGGSCIDSGLLDSGDNHVAILDGSLSSATQVRCGNDSICVLNGAQATDFFATAGMNSIVDMDCTGASSCSLSAQTAAGIVLDCGDAGMCSTVASDDTALEVNCRGTGTCRVRAEAANHATIDCTGAGHCTDIHCTDGAECLLQCNPDDPVNTPYCQLTECTGVNGGEGLLVDCGSGLWACNRACS